MIIAGTAIGAGMQGNPTSTAGVWFIGSILALIYTWFCMTTSGLMILEANLHYPTGSSFDTIVKDLLGKVGILSMVFPLLSSYIFWLMPHNLRRRHYTKSAKPGIQFCWKCGGYWKNFRIFNFLPYPCSLRVAFNQSGGPFHNCVNCRMVVAFFPFYHWFIKLCKNRSFIQYSLSKRTNIFTLFIDRTSSLSRVLWFPRECSKSRQILRSWWSSWWNRSLLVRD